MGATAAERQRRSRRHRAGDHALCSPDRCDQAPISTVTGPVTGPVTPVSSPSGAVSAPNPGDRAPELAERGRRLWQELTELGPELRPAERVLAEEACRLADRLDVLDRILRGDLDAWISLQSANEDGSVVKVVVNSVLAEVRQQQVALKQLLGELRQSMGGAGKSGPSQRSGARASGGEGVAGVADLTARIAARGTQATG